MYIAYVLQSPYGGSQEHNNALTHDPFYLYIILFLLRWVRLKPAQAISTQSERPTK